MPTDEKLLDRANRPAGGAVTPPARHLARRLVLSAPGAQTAPHSTSSAWHGNRVPASTDPTPVTETDVSLVVMAPVLTVCRHLADIANIALGLPGVRSVHAGAEQTLTIRYGGAAKRIARLAPGRFRIDQQRQSVEWEIRASALYSGTLSIHGDCNISRLQSIMRNDQPSLLGAARDVHLQMLRRIARAVEQGVDRLRAPLARDGAAVLGEQGLVRECWAGDVPGFVGPDPEGR